MKKWPLVGWVWGSNTQLVNYGVWKKTLSRIRNDCGQIPSPTLVALWLSQSGSASPRISLGQGPLLFGSEDPSSGLGRDPEVRSLLRKLKDSLDYRLKRDPVLSKAITFQQSLPRDQIPAAASFLLRKLAEAEIVALVECEPDLLRNLPETPPSTFVLPPLEREKEIEGITHSIHALETAPRHLDSRHWALLSLGLAHLTYSEQTLANEVLEAVAWFDFHRSHTPGMISTGDSISDFRSGESEAFPTGGIDSLTTSGPWENLLPSELAYFEDKRPSLFELRWLNQELLFHGRDESIHRRPVIDWKIQVAPQVGDWLFQPQDCPFRLISMGLGWTISMIQRLKSALGNWDFRVSLEIGSSKKGSAVPGSGKNGSARPVNTESAQSWEASTGSGDSFLSFLTVFANRLGFQTIGPKEVQESESKGKQAEDPLRHHKLIRMDLGGYSPTPADNLNLVLFPPAGTQRPSRCFLWDSPLKAEDWLELDRKVMVELPKALGKG